MKAWEGRVGEGQRRSHHRARPEKGEHLCGRAVPHVGLSSRGQAVEGDSGAAVGRSWTWREWRRVRTSGPGTSVSESTGCHLTRSSPVLTSSSLGQLYFRVTGEGAGRGSSALAEFAKEQTTTLEGKGWERRAE